MSVSPELLAIRDAITVALEREPLLVVSLPLTLVSEANAHEHWRGRQKRSKAQRAAVAMTIRAGMFLALDLGKFEGLVCRLVRVAPRALDSDNLARSLKACRDGVADALGINDRDPRVTWLPDQTKGRASVIVELYLRTP